MKPLTPPPPPYAYSTLEQLLNLHGIFFCDALWTFVMIFVLNMECYDGFDPLRTGGGLAAIAAFSIVRLSWRLSTR